MLEVTAVLNYLPSQIMFADEESKRSEAPGCFTIHVFYLQAIPSRKVVT